MKHDLLALKICVDRVISSLVSTDVKSSTISAQQKTESSKRVNNNIHVCTWLMYSCVLHTFEIPLVPPSLQSAPETLPVLVCVPCYKTSLPQ